MAALLWTVAESNTAAVIEARYGNRFGNDFRAELGDLRERVARLEATRGP